MNIVLWVIQAVLAFFYVSGGAYKIIKIDDLLKMPAMRTLPRGIWQLLGVIEVVGGIMLIAPGILGWSASVTAMVAAVLAVETLAVAAIYARFSRKLTAANPLVWSAVMGILVALVAVGRYAIV